MKPRATVSLQHAIVELEREVASVVELDSDPMIRGVLADQSKLPLEKPVS